MYAYDARGQPRSTRREAALGCLLAAAAAVVAQLRAQNGTRTLRGVHKERPCAERAPDFVFNRALHFPCSSLSNPIEKVALCSPREEMDHEAAESWFTQKNVHAYLCSSLCWVVGM